MKIKNLAKNRDQNSINNCIAQKIIHEIETFGGMNGFIEKGEAIAIIKQYLQGVEDDG